MGIAIDDNIRSKSLAGLIESAAIKLGFGQVSKRQKSLDQYIKLMNGTARGINSGGILPKYQASFGVDLRVRKPNQSFKGNIANNAHYEIVDCRNGKPEVLAHVFFAKDTLDPSRVVPIFKVVKSPLNDSYENNQLEALKAFTGIVNGSHFKRTNHEPKESVHPSTLAGVERYLAAA